METRFDDIPQQGQQEMQDPTQFFQHQKLFFGIEIQHLDGKPVNRPRNHQAEQANFQRDFPVE